MAKRNLKSKTVLGNLAVVGIDPGVHGAIVFLDGGDYAAFPLPIKSEGKEKLADYWEFYSIVHKMQRLAVGRKKPFHVFLERAVSFGLGTRSAFNYGRSFQVIVCVLEIMGCPVTYVEPSKWTKEMHEGIAADLKPKAKSLIAAKRLFPEIYEDLPKKPKGGIHDGIIDALLIAGYGLRKLGPVTPVKSDIISDFY